MDAIIKAIRPDLIEDPAYVTMFLDEARLAANVQSQYVGATVGQLIKACQPSPIPLPFALTFLAQSLRGLDDAHAALSPTGEPLRIVHRDLAPKNILVGIDGRARGTRAKRVSAAGWALIAMLLMVAALLALVSMSPHE